MDIYYYDSTDNTRKIVPIEAQTAIFSGATPTRNGSSGMVPTPTTADVGKFLSSSGTWQNPPRYLSQTEAEDLFIGVDDEISAKTAQTADKANALTYPQTITVRDNHGHSANGTFTGSSTTVITLPDAMFTNVTVSAALTATTATTATNCTGNAGTADQLKNKVTITVVDSTGKIAGTPTRTDFSDEVILHMPPITAAPGSSSSGSTSSLRLYITDGTNTGTPEAFSLDGEDHGIRLPDILSLDTTGEAAKAARLTTPIKIALKSGSALGTAKSITGNEGNTNTTTIELPTTLTATLRGNADTATSAGKDSEGNQISTYYAPKVSPALSGAPTAPTPLANETTLTRIATVGFVKQAIANQLGISYEGEGDNTLSLVEISKAINDDKDFAKTISDTYLQKSVLLSSMLNLGSVARDNMFYTDSANHVAATPLTSVARTFLSASTAEAARTAIGAIDVNATVAKAVQLSNPVNIKIQDNKGTDIATQVFQGNNNVTLKLDKTMALYISTDTVVGQAMKWSAPITMSVSDKSGAHRGTTKSVDGTEAVILPLPDTITATTFDGTAKYAQELKTSVKMRVTDGTNAGNETTYHGTESAISLNLPSTIKADAFNGVADTALALKNPQTIQITDNNNGAVTSGTFTGSATTTLKLPQLISVNISGEATTATRLSTGRKLKTNLSSTTDISFDGSADITSIPITGVLGVAYGGTGQSNLDNVTVGKAKALNTARTIMGGTFDGTTNLELFAVCSTAGNVAAKKVSISSVKALTNGLMISVYFSGDNTASDIKLQINSLTAYDILGPDGQLMINQRAGLYHFVYYNQKFHTARVPDIEAATASEAEKATKDANGNDITSTYATKTEAVGNITINSYTLQYQKISEIGTATLHSITLPKYAEVAQNKVTSGTYPLLQNTTQNATATKVTGEVKYNADIKIDNTNNRLIVPQLQADVLILPTTASTIPGAIWIEG